MTLILAVITHSFAMLASDRRITTTEVDPSEPGGYRVTCQDDTDTKCWLVDRSHAMGFTGLARIRVTDLETGLEKRRRLESWFMEHLHPEPHEDYFDVLADVFGPLCEDQHWYRPHTFLAAGYRDLSRRGAINPEIVTVTNSRTMVHQFDVTREPLENRPFLFRHAGWQLDRDTITKTERAIDISIKRRPRQPDRLIETLLNVMIETSDKSDGWVGKESIVTTFPRTAVPFESPSPMWLGPPDSQNYREIEVSQTYPDPTKPDTTARFAPAFLSRTVNTAGMQQSFGSASFMGPLEGM